MANTRQPAAGLCSRRELLRRLGALGVAGPAAGALGLNLAAMGQASAATAGDYRALVCIFLYGGNDAYNTVLATDTASWAAYGAVRGTADAGIALAAPGVPRATAANATLAARLGGVLPIAPAHNQGRSFAMHPAMPELASLFGQRRLGVVANVGPLVAPVTKAAVINGSAPLPPKRFSHNDQQSVWQAFSTEGATRGWGGRMADLLLAGNTQAMFSATSVAGSAVWLSGQTARAYQMAPTGPIRLGGADGTLFGSALAQQKLQALGRATRQDQLLQREHAATVGRSIDAEALLRSSLPAAGAGPWGTGSLPPGKADPLLQYTDPETGLRLPNPLAAQLQGVARLIAARQSLGMNRQVFFVGLNGFDTHADQTSRQSALLAQLSQGLAWFDQVLQAMGVDQNVTTFTASEFGRAFASNGDGCDHGWGAHHLVMGGAVRGGDLYGRFPTYGTVTGQGAAAFNSDDQLEGGALLPAVPVDAYAATLGRWMGLSDSQLLDILPNLGRFSTGARQLGFMG